MAHPARQRAQRPKTPASGDPTFGSGAAQNQPVTLVGHSWGANLAVKVAASFNRMIDKPITVDGVPNTAIAKASDFLAARTNTKTWIDIRSTREGGTSGNGNAIAGLGEFLGGGVWNLGGLPDRTSTVSGNHGDFQKLLLGGCSEFANGGNCN
jgi:pimeloyl-ACP methyl ester carboxylesterase